MLAIVIPYYKIDFFEQALVSLAEQTDKKFNVYIGNDASPNNPEYIIGKYNNLLNITYKRFSENMGSRSLVKQWERCLDMVINEEWIMVLGDDDCLEKNVVEAFYKNLNNISITNTCVVRFATLVIDKNNAIVSDIFKKTGLISSTKLYMEKIDGIGRSSLSESIFKKSKFLKYRFKEYPLGWHSDDMAFLMFSEFGIIYNIEEAIVRIRVSAESISGGKDNLTLKKNATIAFYTDLLNNYSQNFTKDELFKMQLILEQLIEDKKFTNWTFYKKYYKEFGIKRANSFVVKAIKDWAYIKFKKDG